MANQSHNKWQPFRSQSAKVRRPHPHSHPQLQFKLNPNPIYEQKVQAIYFSISHFVSAARISLVYGIGVWANDFNFFTPIVWCELLLPPRHSPRNLLSTTTLKGRNYKAFACTRNCNLQHRQLSMPGRTKEPSMYALSAQPLSDGQTRLTYPGVYLLSLLIHHACVCVGVCVPLITKCNAGIYWNVT